MTAIQTYEEAALKVAMWWSEKSFSTPLNQNNGDNSSAGSFAFMMMNILSKNAQSEITKEQIKKFEDKLYELLIDKNRPGYPFSCISKDYHPDLELAEACAFAGINSMCLPCKTSTTISRENKVMAYYQYGSKGEEI